MPINYDNATTGLFKDISYFDKKKNKKRINFSNSKYDKLNKVLFRKTLHTQDFIEYDFNELHTITNDNNLFEEILPNRPRKLFIDLDLKDKETDTKFYISVNDVNNLCIKFCSFLKTTYKIEQTITYIIQGSIKDKLIFDNNDKIICSFHLIFNVYTNTDIEQSQIITEFMKQDIDLIKYIDTSLYRTETTIRALNQSKGKEKNKALRVDNLKVLNKNDTQIITDYFITSIILDRDTYLKVDIIEPPKADKSKYNIIYQFNQLKHLQKYISKLQDKELSSKLWSKNLFLIIRILRFENIEWEKILEHEIIKEFLEKSKVGKYNNV